MYLRILYPSVLLVVVIAFSPGRPGLEVQAHGGFFDSVNNLASSVGDFMDDALSKAESVVQSIQSWDNFLKEAIEEDCEFECPNGDKPKRNPYYAIPEPNGCGSLGVKFRPDLLPLQELTTCCDRHDICYDTCNMDKEDCDRTFKRCLYHLCDRHTSKIGHGKLQTCKGAAKVLYTGTAVLGCKSYKDAQRKACLCENKNHSDL